MKYLLSSICALTVSAFSLQAASPNLLSSAAKAEMEEKIRRLQAEVEDMKALNTSLTSSLNALNKQVRDQHAAMKKMIDAYKLALGDFAQQSALDELAKSVREVERARKSDQAQVSRKLQELRDIILKNASKPTTVYVAPNPKNDAGGRPAREDESKGVYHEIQKGETVMDIMLAYNSELKRTGRRARISLQQIRQANPTVNLDRVRVGQKIFIPIID